MTFNASTWGRIRAALCVLSFALLLILSLGTPVSAQQLNTDYKPLSPLPNTVTAGGTTSLATYLPGLFRLIIAVTAVLAVIMLIIGGFEYITTDSIYGRSEGKQRIQNAITGLILAIVSWLILYSINPNLVVFNLNLTYTARQAPTGPGLGGTSSQTASQGAFGVEPGELDHAAAVSGLGSGFTVVSTGNNCIDRTRKDCTSLEGVKPTTITGIVALRDACGTACGNLVVSGGTEVGHEAGPQSHFEGYKIDISKTQGDAAAFSSYISGVIKAQQGVSTINLDTNYLIKVGSTWYVARPEGDHWDITVKP